MELQKVLEKDDIVMAELLGFKWIISVYADNNDDYVYSKRSHTVVVEGADYSHHRTLEVIGYASDIVTELQAIYKQVAYVHYGPPASKWRAKRLAGPDGRRPGRYYGSIGKVLRRATQHDSSISGSGDSEDGTGDTQDPV